jgi:hypothetical protein
MRQLVFVHGRAQQDKDARALKDEWMAAWRRGLGKTGLEVPLADHDIRFPYYGQTLFELAGGTPAEQAAEIVIRGAEGDAEGMALLAAVMEEARTRVGITDAEIAEEAGAVVAERGVQNWEWVQAVCRRLDRHPGLSGASLALATNDVFQYLRNDGLRAGIDEGVAAAVDPGTPTVLVSHSLGTVVAYSLLRDRMYSAGWQIPQFVTLGSPLAIRAVRAGFEPVRSPASVGHWFNAMDERDIVALYPLIKPHFDVDPPITNKTDVDNHTRNRHGIAGYLEDPVVARLIHDAVVAP